MLATFRSRMAARRLAREVRQSLETQPDLWQIAADDEGRPIVSSRSFRIVIVPRAVRIFDAIHLYSDDTEVWLPLLPRLRLRAATRWLLARSANERWAAPSSTTDAARGSLRTRRDGHVWQ